MSELVWCWSKGDKTLYTSNFRIAEKAMREGFFVKVIRKKPHIFAN